MLEEMKKKLETVTKSPELYEKIRKHTNDGLILLDESKDIIFINKRAGEITEFKDEYLVGKNIEELLESDIHQNLEQEVLAKDEFVEKKMNITTKSGENKTVVITIDYFYFNGEENKGFSLLISDITTETKQKEILNALMSHSEVMLAYLDLDFNLVYVNSAYAQKTDHSPEELVGKNHFDLFPDGENKKIFQEVLDKREKMSVKDKDLLDSRESRKEGLYWSLEPVKDDGKKIKGLVLSSYEISDAI